MPDGKILKEVNYKTVPDSNTQQLKLAMGGDVGMTKSAASMTMKLADF